MADNQQQNLHAMRHSLAHIMATAIMRLYPTAKLGVGPVVEDGFYYDIDLGSTKLSEEDFDEIEAEMKRVIVEDHVFERSSKPINEAITWAKDSKQPYKEELLNDLKRAGTTIAKELDTEELGLAVEGESKIEEVSFYRNGDFIDLCRGPHVASTGKVGAFKLMRISGAYWRGKDSNPQMQRIYGVGFATDKELRQYLTMLEEAKRRDHRKLGQELDLFVFSPLVGAGLPLWTPRGTVLRNELDKFVQELRDEAGFQEVAIPHITKKDLYEKSGHWTKFKDELFKISTREGHEYAMKPMNCPHHTQIYDSKPRSYRDLPIRYRDTTMVYRDEQSGELGGLSRVLCITQDDSHIFCRLSQAKSEALKLWDITERFYSTVGIELRLRLSLHDPDNQDAYIGSEEKWQEVEEGLREIARERVGNNFVEAAGDAAFYGPKLDFLGRDALGREHQVATVQIDFGQPEGFDLTCTNEEGEDERIVMVHCTVMGSLERFLSVYIEHSAGKFPVWLAPEQVRIVTLNQDQGIVDFANSIAAQAKKLGVRATVDAANDSVSKKIRNAELMKVPYTVVIGPKEVETNEIVPRIRKDMEVAIKHPPRTPYELVKTVANEAKSRVTRTSF
ncbi:MAG TPA: threonine--tRNA ligase [Candidatus Saccharimonadales bacterium]|nr:threonine--tRNA ligase [Candidatus Saccharimonadales bacterium]